MNSLCITHKFFFIGIIFLMFKALYVIEGQLYKYDDKQITVYAFIQIRLLDR